MCKICTIACKRCMHSLTENRRAISEKRKHTSSATNCFGSFLCKKLITFSFDLPIFTERPMQSGIAYTQWIEHWNPSDVSHDDCDFFSPRRKYDIHMNSHAAYASSAWTSSDIYIFISISSYFIQWIEFQRYESSIDGHNDDYDDDDGGDHSFVPTLRCIFCCVFLFEFESVAQARCSLANSSQSEEN